MMLAVLQLFVFVVVASGFTLQEIEDARHAMENPDLFEGDILGIDPNDRSAHPKPSKKWPNGTIPYVIENDLKRATKVIEDGLEDYHNKTCLRFVKRTNEEHYIRFFRGKGCYSLVGMESKGPNPVSLGYGCHIKNTVIHEVGHAVGFYHEQNRSDRNKYLKINYENIIPGLESQFVKLYPYENLLLTKFDYDSIMLYGSYAFSKSHYLMTMTKKDGTELPEPLYKEGLSKKDVQRIKMLYNC